MITGQYSVTTHVESVLSPLGRSALHTAKLTLYANGKADLLVADKALFHDGNLEDVSSEARARKRDSERRARETYVSRGTTDGEKREPSPESLERSMRRARSRVRAIALANDFDFFVTLTLDPAKVDRYDVAAVTRKLSQWADNQARRHGLRYVLVPERHKDGAIHFHGFMSWDGPEGAPVTESGTYSLPGGGKPRKARSAAQAALWLSQGAKPVYNLPAWTLGYTTAIEVYGEYGAAVSYVCKYVSKQMFGNDGEAPSGKIGGRWYYSGGALRKPQEILLDLNQDEAGELPGAFRFAVPGSGFVSWRGEASGLVPLLEDVSDQVQEAAGEAVEADYIRAEREGKTFETSNTEKGEMFENGYKKGGGCKPLQVDPEVWEQHRFEEYVQRLRLRAKRRAVQRDP